MPRPPTASPPGRGAATALLALACGAAMAAPLWVGRFLPLLDLPQHLALATVLITDPAGASPLLRFFEAEPFEFTPYWIHYALLAGLGHVVPMETAARLLLTAYVLLLPFAAMELCGAVGAPRAAGLLAAPLALNTNFYYGFMAYCLGILLLLPALALAVRQVRAPRLGRGVLLAASGVLLFFTHPQPLAFLGLAAFVLAALHPAGIRTRAAALLPLLPAGLLIGLWVQQATTSAPGRERYFAAVEDPRARFEPVTKRVLQIPASISGAYRDRSDRALLGLWAAAMAALAFSGRRQRPRAGAALALLLLAVACTLLLPFSVQGQWNIAPRFAWLAALLAAPFAAVPRAAGAVALALSMATGANAVRLHRAFDAEVGGFDRVLAALPVGSRLLPLVFDARGSLFHTWPYLHFGHYAAVRRESYVAHSFAANAPLPVRIRPAARVPVQGVWRADRFDFAAHASYFDAFLVRDPGGLDPLAGRRGLTGAAAAGPWRLYLRDPVQH